MLPEIERGRVPTSLPDSPSRQRFCRVRKFWLWIFPKFILIVMTQMEGVPLMSARDNLGRSLIPLCLMKAVTASPISFWPCLWRFRCNLRHQDPWSDAWWCQYPALRTVIRSSPIFRVQPCVPQLPDDYMRSDLWMYFHCGWKCWGANCKCPSFRSITDLSPLQLKMLRTEKCLPKGLMLSDLSCIFAILVLAYRVGFTSVNLVELFDIAKSW